MTEPLKITAYEVGGQGNRGIVKAPYRRAWMDETTSQFVYRCLPLVIANQAGWFIQNEVEFMAMWTGGVAPDDIRLAFPSSQGSYATWYTPQSVQSHFGHGVLTFGVPYVFRTPPGYNLWVKGPANYFKDGIHPLEGVIETDWAYATFTMNWRFTRPNQVVRFEAGEPICQLVPVPRGLVEQFQPEIRSIADEPELFQRFNHWQASRTNFTRELNVPSSEAQKRGWERDYFQGRLPDGTRIDDHQTRLHVKEFVRVQERQAG
jgi:hypothetical protein